MSADLVTPATTTVLVETATEGHAYLTGYRCGATLLTLHDGLPHPKWCAEHGAGLTGWSDRAAEMDREARTARIAVTEAVPLPLNEGAAFGWAHWESPSVELAGTGVDAEVSAPGARVAPTSARRPVQPPVVTS